MNGRAYCDRDFKARPHNLSFSGGEYQFKPVHGNLASILLTGVPELGACQHSTWTSPEEGVHQCACREQAHVSEPLRRWALNAIQTAARNLSD